MYDRFRSLLGWTRANLSRWGRGRRSQFKDIDYFWFFFTTGNEAINKNTQTTKTQNQKTLEVELGGCALVSQPHPLDVNRPCALTLQVLPHKAH